MQMPTFLLGQLKLWIINNKKAEAPFLMDGFSSLWTRLINEIKMEELRTASQAPFFTVSFFYSNYLSRFTKYSKMTIRLIRK